jgi:hypothetical protein
MGMESISAEAVSVDSGKLAAFDVEQVQHTARTVMLFLSPWYNSEDCASISKFVATFCSLMSSSSSSSQWDDTVKEVFSDYSYGLDVDDDEGCTQQEVYSGFAIFRKRRSF